MKSWWKQFNYLNTRLLTKYLFFLLFYFVIIGSIALFFHLLLGHDQEIIENWFHESSWYHLILVKILSLGSTFFITETPSKKEWDLWFFWRSIPPSLYVGMLSASTILLFILSPVKREMHYYQYDELMITFLGNALLFLSDLFIVRLALKRDQTKMIHMICLGLLFYLINGLIQGQILYFRCFYLLGFILSFYFLSRSEYGFKAGLVSIIFCFVPLILLFGQDAVWRESLSPFAATKELSFEHFIIVLFLSLYYFEWKIGRLKTERSRHAE